MRKVLVSIFMTSSVFLAGCSSNPKHSCPIPNSCAPIQEVYEASKKDEDYKGYTVYPKATSMEEDEDIFGLGDEKNETDDDKKLVKKVKKRVAIFKMGKTPGVSSHGAVWHPPQPYWVWMAHWVDNEGILHSGSYAWFTSKGYWEIDGVRVETSSELSVDDEEKADFGPGWVPDAPMQTGSGPSFSAIKGAASDVMNMVNGEKGKEGSN